MQNAPLENVVMSSKNRCLFGVHFIKICFIEKTESVNCLKYLNDFGLILVNSSFLICFLFGAVRERWYLFRLD